MYNFRTSRWSLYSPSKRFAFTGAKVCNEFVRELKCERSVGAFKNKLEFLNLPIQSCTKTVWGLERDKVVELISINYFQYFIPVYSGTLI